MANSEVESSTFIRLKEIENDLTPSDRKVSDYIMEHREEIIYLSITDLAQRCKVSESTIVRLCKKLRLKGYQELRVELAREIASPVKQIHEMVNLTDTVQDIQKKVFQAAAQSLYDTSKILAIDCLEKAIEWIKQCNSITFFGIGGSGVIASDAFYRFSKLGIPSHVATDGHSQMNKAIHLQEKDVVIAVSHSGKTRDVIHALDIAKQHGARTIAITQFGHSPITEVADLVLFTSSTETAFRSEAMASRIAQAVLLDTICVAVGLAKYEDVVSNYEKSRKATERMRIKSVREIER